MSKILKLGLMTPILDSYDVFQAIDFAVANGFQSLEVAAWPKLPEGQKPSRRYADVCHIDADRALVEGASYYRPIVDYAAQKGVELASLCYCDNPLVNPTAVEHLKKLIRVAPKMGIPVVTTFVGRDQYKTVEENFDKLFVPVWKPLVELAEEQGVKIAIENCPMLFTNDQWPGGQNLMTTPANWRRAFELIPSPNLQICYDPSHFIWQMIDPIAPIFEFADRLAACHAKDIILRRDKLQQVGIMATPLQFMQPVIPGHGDVPWAKYFEALYAVGFTGAVALEFEDKTFEGDDAVTHNAIRAAKRHLDQFVV